LLFFVGSDEEKVLCVGIVGSETFVDTLFEESNVSSNYDVELFFGLGVMFVVSFYIRVFMFVLIYDMSFAVKVKFFLRKHN
jgi:hypothetical protein